METAHKSVHQQQQQRVERRSPDSIRERKRGKLFNYSLLVVLLAAWFIFVQALEGLDGDTVFLAVFCAALSMFIIKSLIAGFTSKS